MNKGLLILGIIILGLGIYAGQYQEEHLWGVVKTSPYEQYSLPAIIGGAVLFMIGLLVPSSTGSVSNVRYTCKECNASIPQHAKHCPSCGRQL